MIQATSWTTEYSMIKFWLEKIFFFFLSLKCVYRLWGPNSVQQDTDYRKFFSVSKAGGTRML